MATERDSRAEKPTNSSVAAESVLQTLFISDWSYSRILARFGMTGCTVPGCPFHDDGSGTPAIFFCALNLSDAILRAGHTLPPASNVNYCTHANPRVRNADGMARIVRAKNGGAIDVSGWANRPSWQGIVYFEGGPDLQNATGHIDLWNGTQGVHAQYPTATTIWFWRLAA